MADTKISALSAATALTGAETVPVVQGGATVRTTAYDASLVGGHPGYVTGLWYTPPHATVLAAVITTIDTLYAVPLQIFRPISIQALGLNCTTGQAGGAARIGIYSNTSGRPDALLHQGSSTLDLSTSGGKSISVTGSPTYQPGWYWLATLFTASSTMPSVVQVSSTDAGTAELIGHGTLATAFQASNGPTGVSVARTYASGFPSTFGAATIRTGGQATPAGAFQLA